MEKEDEKKEEDDEVKVTSLKKLRLDVSLPEETRISGPFFPPLYLPSLTPNKRGRQEVRP